MLTSALLLGALSVGAAGLAPTPARADDEADRAHRAIEILDELRYGHPDLREPLERELLALGRPAAGPLEDLIRTTHDEAFKARAEELLGKLQFNTVRLLLRSKTTQLDKPGNPARLVELEPTPLLDRLFPSYRFFQIHAPVSMGKRPVHVFAAQPFAQVPAHIQSAPEETPLDGLNALFSLQHRVSLATLAELEELVTAIRLILPLPAEWNADRLRLSPQAGGDWLLRPPYGSTWPWTIEVDGKKRPVRAFETPDEEPRKR